MDIALTQEAEEELASIPPAEQRAMQAAFEKLEQYGDLLPFPHSSKIIERNLRELRPRAGRGRWRAFYRRIGEIIVIGAIGPEARVNPQGFRQSTGLAEERLDKIQAEREQ